jgi:hypothetical protein
MDQLEEIKKLVRLGLVRVTQHAHQEMVAEDYNWQDLFEAMFSGIIIEDYPEHRRGACCLLGGETYKGRKAHIVCTTDQPILVIITVYEPKLPKWKSLTERIKS